MYLIKEYNISINVLEYFILIYYMMKWESAFHRGDIIEARSDNTAAVSWMNKNRGGKSFPPSEILAKLFCSYSYKTDLVISSNHIIGETNILSDDLSRITNLQEAQWLEVNTREPGW